MRIAVLADIHGNRLALEAVLADVRSHAPDLIVNLGDHVSGPLEAALTADMLAAQRGWVHIRGNHDRQVLESEREKMGLSDRAAAEQITDEHRAWLRSLPATKVVAGDVLLCHGTPQRDLDYLLEEVAPDGVKAASEERIRERLGDAKGAVLCGHSHVPGFARLEDGTVVVNPGSVGLQAFYDSDHPVPHAMEAASPHARYALLDRASDGWHATFRTVEYEWEMAAQLARAGGRMDWAHALATGCVLR